VTKKNNLIVIAGLGVLAYFLLKGDSTASGSGSGYWGASYSGSNPLEDVADASTDATTHFIAPSRLAELSLQAGDDAGEFARLNINDMISINPVVDFSKATIGKINKMSNEEFLRASSFKSGGSPVQNRDRVPVSSSDRAKNIKVINTDTGFEKIRDGAYRKTSYENGKKITRVIYT